MMSRNHTCTPTSQIKRKRLNCFCRFPCFTSQRDMRNIPRTPARILGLLIIAASSLPAIPEHVAALLRRHAGFSEQDIAAARRGQRIVRMLETDSPTEVAFAGVIRLPISLDQYIQRVRDGNLYRKNETILQVGRFGESPSLLDVQNLHFERYDLSSPNNSRSSRESAERINKETLLEVIKEYEKTGAIFAGALGARPERIDVNSHFAPMVKAAGYLREHLPAAYEYLLSYPNARHLGRDDYFLWKQMTFGFRPLTRLAQVALWEQTEQGVREATVLTKQIYANRYFRASFQIDHIIADNSDPAHPAVYLITFNRGSSDFLEGRFGRAIRPIVLARTQSAAEKTLDQARAEMEAEYREPGK
jgi:hypothetical protein